MLGRSRGQFGAGDGQQLGIGNGKLSLALRNTLIRSSQLRVPSRASRLRGSINLQTGCRAVLLERLDLAVVVPKQLLNERGSLIAATQPDDFGRMPAQA